MANINTHSRVRLWIQYFEFLIHCVLLRRLVICFLSFPITQPNISVSRLSVRVIVGLCTLSMHRMACMWGPSGVHRFAWNHTIFALVPGIFGWICAAGGSMVARTTYKLNVTSSSFACIISFFSSSGKEDFCTRQWTRLFVRCPYTRKGLTSWGVCLRVMRSVFM